MSDFLQPWDYLEVAARTKPGAPGLVSATQTLTFAEFADIAARMAHVLRERGVEPGDVIALNVPNQLNSLFTWATFHEAAVTCAFQPFLLDSDDIPVTLVVSTVPVAGVSDDALLIVDDDFLEALSENDATDEPRRYASDDSVIRYTFTSGTTGRPKAIAQSATDTARKFARSWSHWRTDGGMMSLFSPVDGPGWMVRFACVMNAYPFLVRGSHAENIDLMRRARPKHLRASAGQLAELARELNRVGVHLDSLETVNAGGGVLPRPVAESMLAVTSANVISTTYASTEVGIVATNNDGVHAPNCMGTVVPGVTVEIVDPDSDEPLSDGSVGVIRVTSPDMVRGYHRNPEATAASFRHGRFYPGDLGKLENGKLFLEGRVSELINSGGTKTDPNWVDQHVLRVDKVTDCATFAFLDSNSMAAVAAAVVIDGGLSDDELRAAVVDSLGSHTPTMWFRVDEIPRNAMGKPLRGELTERFSVGSTPTS